MREQATGAEGEWTVKIYLESKGYKILERNYHERVGEVDLIALDPQTEEIVFVEVKTRKLGSLGRPEDSVNRKKISKIEKTALRWLSKNKKQDCHWRIDIVGLELAEKPVITHLENVTL